MLNSRYSINKILGQGGMGKVFLCSDCQTSEQVAIKECFLPQSSAKMIRRIKREYNFLSKMNHPCIVKATDFFHTDNRYFIVMEYIEGITLEQLIKNNSKSIDFAKQLDIAIKICEGVVALNKKGIIHRDLKPSNIIITDDYAPKILDLGIAKSINAELTTLTKTNGIVGTTSYMSPEQIYGKVEKNTDVFCLGIVFYQFFTWMKDSPFYAGSAIATMDKIIHRKLPLLPHNNNPVMRTLANILRVALRKESTRRFSSTEKMLDSLRKAEKANQFSYFKNLFSIENFKKSILLLVISALVFIFAISRTQKNTQQNAQDKTTDFMVKALEYLGRKEYQKSIECCNKIIAMGINSKEVYFQRAIGYMNLLKYDDAIRDFGTVEKIDAQDPLLYRNRAFIYKEIEETEKAVKELTILLTITPEDPSVYNNRGSLYYDLGLYKEAIADFTQTIKRDRSAVYAYANRAKNHLARKKYRKAIRDTDRALNLNPNYIDALFTRGESYYAMQRYNKAVIAFSKIINIDTQNFEAYNSRGISYFDSEQYRSAILDFTKLITLENDNESGYYNRGNCYYSLRLYSQAIDDYTKAIEIEPRNLEAYNNRALLYLDTKKYQKSINDFNNVLQINPNDIDALYNKSSAHFMIEQYNDVIENLTTVILLDPTFVNAYVNRGNAYYKLAKYQPALDNWQKAISMDKSYLKNLRALIKNAQKQLSDIKK